MHTDRQRDTHGIFPSGCGQTWKYIGSVGNDMCLLKLITGSPYLHLRQNVEQHRQKWNTNPSPLKQAMMYLKDIMIPKSSSDAITDWNILRLNYWLCINYKVEISLGAEQLEKRKKKRNKNYSRSSSKTLIISTGGRVTCISATVARQRCVITIIY